MYATARATSSSVSDGSPPRGGIARTPLMASPTSSFSPSLTSGAQAAFSPSFGAPATPVWWQLVQTAL